MIKPNSFTHDWICKVSNENKADRILVETDMDYDRPEVDADETLRQILVTLAALRNEGVETLANRIEENARAFLA